MTDYRAIRQLSELDAASIDVAGGKAANLGELIRGGFPVPPGFVITTDGYADFVEANALQAPISNLASQAPDDPASVDSVSAKIRALFSGREHAG